MARTDEPLKKLFKNKEMFADLFNGAMFHGKQVIKPEKLTEINTENIHIQEPKYNGANSNITKRYRDLCMKYDDEILQIILGCEDQSEVDYAMPIRTMLYDALAYTEQQNDLEMRKKEDGTYYRGKMTKEQKVLPVLSIIFYYGDEPWSAAKSLHDVIKWPKDINIKEMIPDYKMNLIWAYDVEDIERFKSDLQYILYMLKYKQETAKLKEYINENDEKLNNMQQDSHNAIMALFGSEVFESLSKTKKGEMKMVRVSKALLDIKNEGRNEGRNEGELLSLIVLINKKYKKGKNLSTIADEVEEDEEKVSPIYKLIEEHPDYDKEKIFELLQQKNL